MPLRQGHPTNFTCISSPSKPASTLILYRNEQIISDRSSSIVSYELDTATKKNVTKLIYKLNDPDSNWDDVNLRCEQIYTFANNYRKDVSRKLQTYCKCSAEAFRSWHHFFLSSTQINPKHGLNRKIVIHWRWIRLQHFDASFMAIPHPNFGNWFLFSATMTTREREKRSDQNSSSLFYY